MERIRYRKGFKYQLHDTHEHKLKVNPNKKISTGFMSIGLDGVLTIRFSYAWDGPSGPTWDTESSMRGSLVHDALYQLLRMQLLPASYRKAADNELLYICIADGMWKWRAKAWYKSVRKLAGPAANPKSIKQIKSAPR